MHEVDLEVPDKISFVGFGDIPEASYFPPPLTTVHQEFSEVGTRATALLLSQLRGEPSESVVVVDADLVVRASAAPPR